MEASVPRDFCQPNISAWAFAKAYRTLGLKPLRGDYYSQEAFAADAMTALWLYTLAQTQPESFSPDLVVRELGAGLGLAVEKSFRENCRWSPQAVEAFVNGYDGEDLNWRKATSWYKVWYRYGLKVYIYVEKNCTELKDEDSLGDESI